MIHRLYNIKNMESRQFERREWANEEPTTDFPVWYGN
mgnify:CR=1 FL=1|jgi:hypothetical protein